MIDFNPALGHTLFALPVAVRIGHVPSHRPANDIALECAAFAIDQGCCPGRLFPVRLLALSNASKFATEPVIFMSVASLGSWNIANLHFGTYLPFREGATISLPYRLVSGNQLEVVC